MIATQQGAGWAGAALAVGANLYYVVLVVRGAATPHPVTWAVWALIGALGAGSTIADGAGAGAFVPVAYAASYAVTSGVAIRQFRSRRESDENAVTRYDVIVGVAAVVLALAWKLAGVGPGWLATLAVAADAFALWPTLRYAWSLPSTPSERTVWKADACAALLGLAAVTVPWQAAAAAYPIYLLLGNSAVVLVMLTAPSSRSRRFRGA